MKILSAAEEKIITQADWNDLELKWWIKMVKLSLMRNINIFWMNQKYIVIILLMPLSEKMFIIMSSFVFGYCIGYYSYNFLKPKMK